MLIEGQNIKLTQGRQTIDVLSDDIHVSKAGNRQTYLLISFRAPTSNRSKWTSVDRLSVKLVAC